MRKEFKWSRALSVAGLLAITACTSAPRRPEPAPAREIGALLFELDLDAAQLEKLEQLRRSELPAVERLQLALARIEGLLRRAELERPFDAERVNGLVAEQAEVLAYLRGSESRVVAQIAQLLTAEQGRRFEKLRSEGQASLGASELPVRAPAAQFF